MRRIDRSNKAIGVSSPQLARLLKRRAASGIGGRTSIAPFFGFWKRKSHVCVCLIRRAACSHQLHAHGARTRCIYRQIDRACWPVQSLPAPNDPTHQLTIIPCTPNKRRHTDTQPPGEATRCQGGKGEVSNPRRPRPCVRVRKRGLGSVCFFGSLARMAPARHAASCPSDWVALTGPTQYMTHDESKDL